MIIAIIKKTIKRGNECTERIKDSFLPRFSGRGFSDQTAVPQELHEKALALSLKEAERVHGADYGEFVAKSYEKDIEITIYRKVG